MPFLDTSSSRANETRRNIMKSAEQLLFDRFLTFTELDMVEQKQS